MKKKFALALALALTLSLTACKQPAAEPAASSPEQSVTEVSTPDESVPEQPEEPAPTESTPEQPEETPAVEVAPEEPVSTEPIEEPTPAEPVDLFTDTSETVYATTTVNIRSKPDTNSEKLGQLSWSDSVLRTGIDTASGWSEIQLADGSTAYISSKYLTTIKPEPKPVEQQKPVQQKPVQQKPVQQKPVENPTQKPKSEETDNAPDASIDMSMSDSALDATGGLTGDAAKKDLEEGHRIIVEEYLKGLEEAGGHVNGSNIVLPRR